MAENEHSRILKLPNWVMRIFFLNSHGFSIPKNSAVMFSALLIFCEAVLIWLYINFSSLIFLIFISIGIIISIAILSISLLGVIVIRKDCFNCHFGFHILAHENSHLRLNERDEAIVEEEALKQTYGKLIPLLLSKPKMCKGCYFTSRRMYEATSKFIKEKQQRESDSE